MHPGQRRNERGIFVSSLRPTITDGFSEGDPGANTSLLNLNQAAMTHEMFMQNLIRFAKQVLSAISEHEEKKGVPVA